MVSESCGWWLVLSTFDVISNETLFTYHQNSICSHNIVQCIYNVLMYVFYPLSSELFTLFMFQVFCSAQSSEVTLWEQSPSPLLHLQSCPPPPCQPPHTQRPAAETAAPRRKRVRRPASRAHLPCRAYPDQAGSAARAQSTYLTASPVHTHAHKITFYRC